MTDIIGVIGSGTMGSGIAQMFAENNFTVFLWDSNEACLEGGIENIKKRLFKGVEKNKLSEDEAKMTLSRINTVSNFADFSKTTLIVEAIIEDFNIKAELYKTLEKIISENTVIGSNTSSISITELSKTQQHPNRFLGTHFLIHQQN